ncbi:MAG: phosphatase PAP2 family protein [Gemmataceae bacterium]|nr:phosphatase PAP2 family protein [Gemmataceae bacterium]MCI0742800.1 phosphatase PAP2 family protein [Gemmataceae bacterium]
MLRPGLCVHIAALVCLVSTSRARAQWVLPCDPDIPNTFSCLAPIAVGTLRVPSEESAVVARQLSSNDNLDELPNHSICDGLRSAPPTLWKSTCDFFDEECGWVLQDFRNNYTGRNLCTLGLAVAAVAPLANTRVDQRFQDWYQRSVRSDVSDEISHVSWHLGRHYIVVPVLVAASLGGRCYDESATGHWLHIWGDRSCRALLVGAPAVGILQYGLGASRPDEHSSRWRPFQDENSVAGHGFVGAIPILVAAGMTENRPLKALLYAGSFLTTWSRVNDDAHYLSQAILGWVIAYAAVQSVQQTDMDNRRVLFTPIDVGNGVGIGVLIRY